jgi:predicted Zn-dependent protease
MAYNLLGDSVAQSKSPSTLLGDFAWAAYSLGKVSEARQTMNRLLETSPDSVREQEAKSFLALTAVEPKDFSAVEPKAQDVLKAEPKNVPALMIVAGAHNQRGDKAGATTLYASILGQYPEFAPAEVELATIEAEDSATRGKAYELATRARKARPDDPRVAQLLGELSFERKDYPSAIELLRTSAKTLPPDAKALYCLGMSLWQTKKKSESHDALQRAVDGGLQEPLLSDVKRVLAEN